MSRVDQRMPKARKNQLLIVKLEDETLVYDEANDKAHCLNPTAAVVWKHCDGRMSITTAARLLGNETNSEASEQVVWYAINQLKKSRLLENPGTKPAPVAHISRRGLVRALGIATAVAVPVVSSIVAPTAAVTASCLPDGASCTSTGQCCSNCCQSSVCKPDFNC